MGEPPVEAGAVQDTTADWSAAAAVGVVGTPGTVAAVTLDDAEEAVLVPAALVAVTVYV